MPKQKTFKSTFPAAAISAKKADELIKKIAGMDAKAIKSLRADTKTLSGMNTKDLLRVGDALQKRWRRFSRSPIPIPKPKDDGRWLNRTSRDASVIKVDNDGRPVKQSAEVDPQLYTPAIDPLGELRGQVSSAELLEFVLDRAETEAGKFILDENGEPIPPNREQEIFANDMYDHALEIRKLVDSFSSGKKSSFTQTATRIYAPASYDRDRALSSPWAFDRLDKLVFSEREVAQTLTFEAMQFGAALQRANVWPQIQEFESWWSRKANDAKKAKAEERRQICRDEAMKYAKEGTTIRQAVIGIRKFIVAHGLFKKDKIPSDGAIRDYIEDLFPMRLKTKPATTNS
jgi:hypothetical protein